MSIYFENPTSFYSFSSSDRFQKSVYPQTSEIFPSRRKALNVSYYLPRSQEVPLATKRLNVTSYLPVNNICSHQTSAVNERKSPSYEPTRFGIGSYFPGFTSLSSQVCFSSLLNINSSVSVEKGMIDESPPHMGKWRSITESNNIHMLPTVHSAQTHDWRKKLIRAAEHNIVISGNYCGQHAFDEILELLREKLERNENLKVVIISSPMFVGDSPQKNISNQTLIAELKERYPTQFSLVYSPDVWLLGMNGEFKKTTNHTKYIGIDWGRYYIMGGSAIKDDFMMSGTDNILQVLSEEENVQYEQFQEKLSNLKEEWRRSNPDPVVLREKNQECINAGKAVEHMLINSTYFSFELIPILEKLSFILQLIRQGEIQENPIEFYSAHADQLNLQIEITDTETNEGLLGTILPRIFRDMDFVFSDPNDGYSSGRQLFLEIARMAYRWEALNASYASNHDLSSFTPDEVANLPIFTGNAAQSPKSTDSVTHRIMREPMPESGKLQTQKIGGFDQAGTGTLQMLYQGPEQPFGTNEFSLKILEQIKHAKKRIVINHMYFSPTDKIIEALKEAVEQRGVQIEIITCGVTEDCPKSHTVFGPYNQQHWVRLANQIAPEHLQKLKVFLFKQKNKGLHKKVIVFDDEIVLGGSSNLGYKSLVTSSDHEVNFIAKSKDLARKTLAICEQDKKLSQEIVDMTEISLKSYLQALVYSLWKSLVN